MSHPTPPDPPDSAPPSPGNGAATVPRRNGWLIFSILITFAFLIPVFMLFRPAAEPSARGAHAARHGFIQLDNEEGALLFQAMQISKGDSIYHTLTEPPYVAGTYTPLYMTTVAALDDFTQPNFSRGRVIVWVAALLTGILLVLIVTVTTRNAPLGVLAGFLFLATWEVYQWIGYFRVDFPAIFLSLAGLALIALGRQKALSLAAGALLMTLALYTRQTMIAAPAACIIALFFQRPRRATELILWMLLWGLPPLIFLQITTDGQFLRHTILYNMNTWHKETVEIWARHVWTMHQWFFLAGLLALPFAMFMLAKGCIDCWKAHRIDPTAATAIQHPVLYGFWQPVALYAVLAQWNFIGIGKAGSAENYLLEPIAGWALLLCLTAGGALRLAIISPRAKSRILAGALSLFLLAGTILHALAVTEPFGYQIRFSPMKNPGKIDFQAAAVITSRMREAENPYSELAIYHLQTGSVPVIQPFILSELARQGRWNENLFVDAVKSGKFDLVVALDDLTKTVATDTYTREMLNAFSAAYKVAEVLPTPLWNYYILVPTTEADEPPISDVVYNTTN